MSSPLRHNRRDNNNNSNRSRFPIAQSSRQEWVPRGSAATPAVIPSVAANPPTSFNSNLEGNGEGSNYSSTPPHDRHRGHQGPRNNMGRPWNQRRERERGKQEGKGLKDMDSDNREGIGWKDVSLPQLVQEIQDKLMKGTVECMICYDMVRRSAPIWSCSSCYSIFHLNCTRKWARAPTSVDLSAEKNQGLNWRCPGCQAVQLMAAKDIRYLCFCGKRPEPPSDLYLTPHSCGEPCGKPLEKDHPGDGGSKELRCPHVCVLQCHPGPCPPCKAFAPPQLCPCGKKTITTRCSDRKSALTCGQQCEKLLDCRRHHCERVCHIGPCDTCQVLINASCFCKKRTEVVLCGDMTVKGEVKVQDGVFSCNSICGKKLKCGNHYCNEICHPGPCGECDMLPGRIKTCYCGKTSLQEQRHSCLDPIPTCSQVCYRTLPCGVHQCKEKCHPGNCAPCTVLVTQKCQCSSTSRTVECYKTLIKEEKFTCDKPCGWKKNCGRHRCSERCCPLSNSNNSFDGDWDPHLCSMPCGKKLRCGQHSCESLCHSGHCPPCLETIFTDLTCACGRTSIPPPQPCGTPPPSCQNPCSVPQPCGHSSSHSCHFGDCPPCTIPIAKECVGGHVVLRNIPCGSRDIRCNKLCGKTRQCGMHACARTCHPPPCDSSCGTGSSLRASCGQTCGAPRRDCRHTCTTLCHPSSPCPDVRCEFPVIISCSCGRITTTVPCDAGGGGGGFNTDTVFEASIMQKLPVPLQPVEATNGTSGGSRPSTPTGCPTSASAVKPTVAITKSTSASISKPTTTTVSRPSRSSTPTSRATLPSRSSTPTSRATVSSTKPTAPARSSTPVSRSTARSSTPTSRPTLPASRPTSNTARSSTPTSRPTLPSRAATPTRRAAAVPTLASSSALPVKSSSLVVKSGPACRRRRRRRGSGEVQRDAEEGEGADGDDREEGAGSEGGVRGGREVGRVQGGLGRGGRGQPGQGSSPPQAQA